MAKSQKRTGREPKKPKAPAKKIVILPPTVEDSRQSPKKKPSASPRA